MRGTHCEFRISILDCTDKQVTFTSIISFQEILKYLVAQYHTIMYTDNDVGEKEDLENKTSYELYKGFSNIKSLRYSPVRLTMYLSTAWHLHLGIFSLSYLIIAHNFSLETSIISFALQVWHNIARVPLTLPATIS